MIGVKARKHITGRYLLLLRLWTTCSPLSVLPSRQTCGLAFVVVVGAAAGAVDAVACSLSYNVEIRECSASIVFQ